MNKSNKLIENNTLNKECFIISPIGKPDSDTRKRSDTVLKHIITPAVSTKGYSPVRADNINDQGLITHQIIQHIIDAPLVIADLTEHNPNVFYELAVRHAIRKPIIQVIQKEEQIPFDVGGIRTIYINHQDLDEAEQAKNDIIKQIESLESNPEKIDTPISAAVDFKSILESGSADSQPLGDILSAMTDLRASIGTLESRIKNPEAILPPEYLLMLLDRTQKRRHPILPREIARLEDLIERFEQCDKNAPDTKELKAELRHIMHRIMKYADF